MFIIYPRTTENAKQKNCFAFSVIKLPPSEIKKKMQPGWYILLISF